MNKNTVSKSNIFTMELQMFKLLKFSKFIHHKMQLERPSTWTV